MPPECLNCEAAKLDKARLKKERNQARRIARMIMMRHGLWEYRDAYSWMSDEREDEAITDAPVNN